jgi:DNA invertase Pin-like site-specific DNA recombinase
VYSFWADYGNAEDSGHLCRRLREPTVVIKQAIDTTTPQGRLVFHMLAAIDEFQRELIVEGTHEGLEAARARGRTGGQKPKLKPRQVELARQMYEEAGDDGKRRYTVQQIADEFGVTRPTIYRALGERQGAQ